MFIEYTVGGFWLSFVLSLGLTSLYIYLIPNRNKRKYRVVQDDVFVWVCFTLMIWYTAEFNGWYSSYNTNSEYVNLVFPLLSIVVYVPLFGLIDYIILLRFPMSYLLSDDLLNWMVRTRGPEINKEIEGHENNVIWFETIKNTLNGDLALSDSNILKTDYKKEVLDSLVYELFDTKPVYNAYTTNVSNTLVFEVRTYSSLPHIGYVQYGHICVSVGNKIQKIGVKVLKGGQGILEGQNLSAVVNLLEERLLVERNLIYDKRDFLSNPIPLFRTLVFNRWFQLLAVGKSYMVPVGALASVFHLIFGLYKFVLLGGVLGIFLSQFGDK